MPEKKASGAGVSLRLAGARELANEMATATATLNDSLERVERALVALRLGIEHVISIASPAESAAGEEVLLCFEKISGWGLFIHRTPGEQGEEFGTVKPLRQASRAERSEAADKLEDLVREILEQANTQLAVLKVRSAKAQTLADTLEEISSIVDSEIPF